MSIKPLKIGDLEITATYGHFWTGWGNYGKGSTAFHFFLFKFWLNPYRSKHINGGAFTVTLFNFWCGLSILRRNASLERKEYIDSVLRKESPYTE